MRTSTFRLFAAFLLVISSAETASPTLEAGVIPWTYNAIFGYGPIFPNRVGYQAGYAPLYNSPGVWGGNYGYQSNYGYQANYGYGTSTSYYPGSYWMSSAAPVNTYYGPAYYGGGVVYGSSGGDACGCNPCAISACDPCSGNTNCPNGDCSATRGTYSPDPKTPEDRNRSEITPTFKPSTPDLKDDFVPVERLESDFVTPRTNAPEHNSTIPDGTRSTIPNGIELLPENRSGGTTPMSPTDRPVSPILGIDGTIPDATRSTIPDGNRSTIPDGSRSTIPANPGTNNNSTIPENRRFPLNPGESNFPPPISRPAPTEPSTDDLSPVIPSVELKPLEMDTLPTDTLVVQRKRVLLKTGYRIPEISRIPVSNEPILEVGTPQLAIR